MKIRDFFKRIFGRKKASPKAQIHEPLTENTKCSPYIYELYEQSAINNRGERIAKIPVSDNLYHKITADIAARIMSEKIIYRDGEKTIVCNPIISVYRSSTELIVEFYNTPEVQQIMQDKTP